MVDGAQLVVRGALHAGVDFFVGYPITPASGIYAQMLRSGVGLAAPDEITAAQYLIGAALNGRRPMTATSGPGFLLMAESIGAALAMEAPLTVVLVQRLGPATGSATLNAQGDIHMAEHIVSGGFTLPMLCPARIEECLELTAQAVNLAETFRVPVILLTEKDMVVGKRSVDPRVLRYPEPTSRRQYDGPPDRFMAYGHLDGLEVPPFRPVGDPDVQVRATASTHNEAGTIDTFNERIRFTTERLQITRNLDCFPAPQVDAQDGAEVAVLSHGFTTYAARAATAELRAQGVRVTQLAPRTLFPVLVEPLRAALRGVRRLVVAEENLTGLYRRTLLGEGLCEGTTIREVVGVNVMGRSIAPAQIVAALAPAERGSGSADAR
jgi:2-oxoglutarate ferredoxin oxidoreductase subunit alpha